MEVRKGRSAGGFYPSYHFVEYDPILDAVEAVFDSSSLSRVDVLRASGVSAGTFDRYLAKAVRQPRHSTVAALLRAMGSKEAVRINGRWTEIEGRK